MSSCICQKVRLQYYTVNSIVCFLHLFILFHLFFGLWKSLVQWNVLLAVSINGCGLKGSNSHNPAPNGLERWVRPLNSLTRLLLPLSNSQPLSSLICKVIPVLSLPTLSGENVLQKTHLISQGLHIDLKVH